LREKYHYLLITGIILAGFVLFTGCMKDAPFPLQEPGDAQPSFRPDPANATLTVQERMQLLINTYPPPGKLVDVGGYSLHMFCRGNGSPTVVMEAGAGNGVESWALVSPAIANLSRVCIYDRAGYGWSDPATENLTVARVVRNLHALLNRSGEKSPYILVGHSVAGLYTRSYIRKYPSEVAGLILIDPSHERQLVSVSDEYFREQLSNFRYLADTYHANAELAAQGVFAQNLSLIPLNTYISPKDGQALRALYAAKPSVWEATAEEFQSLDAMSAEVRAENITSVGNIPVIVLIAVNDGNGSASFEPASYRALKKEIAGESPQGSWVLVNGSSHYIQWEKPDIVTSIIGGVIRRIREGVAGN
jgi:pimeloyl-ACP methyl ester carboxylesterase